MQPCPVTLALVCGVALALSLRGGGASAGETPRKLRGIDPGNPDLAALERAQ